MLRAWIDLVEPCGADDEEEPHVCVAHTGGSRGIDWWWHVLNVKFMIYRCRVIEGIRSCLLQMEKKASY
jgi:hypothetical protein